METVTVSKIPAAYTEFQAKKKQISQHINSVKYLIPL